MKANKLVVELFSLAILSGCLIACSKPTKEANTQSMQNMKVNRTNSNAKSNIFADDDYDAMIDEKNSTVLNLSDISKLKAKNVSVSGNVITISSGGTYILTGKLDDGRIVVNAKSDDKVRLVLKGVEISSTRGNPILVENAKKTIITLASDTKNKLELKGEFNKEENKDSVIFSKSDLSFNGTGILNLFSPYGRGIVSQDKVVFVDGKPSKNDYRKFKITNDKNDDYGTMREVIYRRYFRVLKDGLVKPSLVIVDGGLGQINVAREVINELGLDIPVCGLKKDDKHATNVLLG